MASIVPALDLEREMQLMKLFPEPIRLHMLYKGTHHGFQLTTIFSKFDKVGRFILLVYLESGSVRGGYLSKPPKAKQEDGDAFLFELSPHSVSKYSPQDCSNAVVCRPDMLSFGGCLTLQMIHELDYLLKLNLASDESYTRTEWVEGKHTAFVEVELHRVQGAGSVLLTGPWRILAWTEKDRDALKENLVSFKPACQSLKRVRVLLLGPAGSGKSSFINSIRSVMYGQVVLLPNIGISAEGFTKRLKCYDIRSERGGKPTALTLCDVLALGDGETTGLTLPDALAVINGHAPEGYKFQSEAPIDAKCAGYRPEPSMKDKIHCAVFVLDACQVLTYSEGQQTTMRRFHSELSDLDIPQVVLLTHVDQVCHAVQEDVKFVYTGRILQEKMQKAAEVVGLSVSHVFPVKNYSSELSVSCNTDILLLNAVHHILQAVDDTFEDYCPPSPSPLSTGPQHSTSTPVTV
ncbi:interferon-induced protein 44-like isoform X2 [Salvelinus fontinalis]|uniref:interferon-induced protein 44-like isoform X2 n=1 Tax=Salvelinus fontinalis TaxID=8038 RepID=UPI0024852CDF|nr:interferon-induced protein 44-like isoform X2 [Salvelinus fontinalis]